jgi:hypothetical protein
MAKSSKAKTTKKRLLRLKLILIPLFFLGVISLFVFQISRNETNIKHIQQTEKGDFSELKDISKMKNSTFEELEVFFESVAKKKSAVYAFQLLRLASLPPNTDVHLLAHVIGDVLYDQEGIEGIKYCTSDFRNACSHALVINIFYKEGESAIPKIRDACKRSPGGPGAYPMCFHGVGHGVLAYTRYDFEKTVKLCDKMSNKEQNEREAIECAGGAVMEMISGGGHDREIWERQRPKYLKADDPLYLCNQPYMAGKKGICLIYITPYLFEVQGDVLNSLAEENFARAFDFCENYPVKTEDDKSYKSDCFAGFGKEFVVLSSLRDIRNVGNIGEEEIKRVYDWCRLTEDHQGTESCISTALDSFFWGGETSPQASFKFCQIVGSGYKDACYTALAGNINEYTSDTAKKNSLCARLPKLFDPNCDGPQ